MSVQLANRVQRIRPSPTVHMTSLAARLREQGRDVIALSAGEPDFDTPGHIKEAAVAALERGDTKYTPIDGTRALKEAIQAKFRRDNDLEFPLERILVTAGAKQACYNACQALINPGDEVIIPAPYWVSYPEMVRLADGEPVIVTTTSEQGFRMTPEQLAAAITPQTRLLIVNSPSNPTGTVYERADWQALGAVLGEHPRIVVLADDIYEHIHWAEERFTTFGEACPQLEDRTLTVNGVSKCYAMSGWRIGYAGGPEPLTKAMSTIQSQSTTNACSISQAAALAALTGDQSSVREMCRAFKARHDVVVGRLAAIRGFECDAASGAFYAFPSIREALAIKGLRDDVSFCERLLEETGVAVVPGSAFGAPGHLRMSFAASVEMLEGAMARIGEFMLTR